VRFFADFVPYLADIALPLYNLTSESSGEKWSIKHTTAVRIIQYLITTSPVLSYFDPARPTTEVFTDASKFAVGGWLRQTDAEGKEHVICYWSRKLIPAEVNYPTHEREFMGMFEFIK
jgi:hypothetical protein